MIGPREIHIWLARIDVPEESIRSMETVLDDEERARVARFRFEDDQRRAIVARATLRTLLGRYLDRAPDALQFVLGAQGKPSLPDGTIEFNVSHSGTFVALAFAEGSPIGVDVECEQRTSDLLGIAGRFFSPAEADVVRHAADVAGAFFRTWTAKESVIKAAGGGLSIDLRSFRVTPAPDRFTAVESPGGDATLAGWFVQSLPAPGEGYHAAVAVRGDDWTTIVRTIVDGRR
jgi:4'-phosphopantetheinyl transferase